MQPGSLRHPTECGKKDPAFPCQPDGGPMVLRPGRFLVWAIALLPPVLCHPEDVQQFVQRAVQTELAKDRDDHSRWIYFEVDRKEDSTVKQWVAETREGSLRRVIEMNGQAVPEPEQRRKMDAYLRDPSARSKAR